MNRTKKKRILDIRAIIYYLLMSVIAVMFLIPVLWGISGSFRPRDEIFRYCNPISWRTFISENFNLDAYQEIFTDEVILYTRALFNSLFISFTAVALGLFVNSLAGFAFAKFNFRGKNLLFILVVFSFMIPFEIIVIPLYILVKSWNLIDTYYALILPAVANGLAIFLFKQFFEEIPSSLLDAARIDGASVPTTLFKIVLPLSKPVIIFVALILFLGQWDALFWPLIAVSQNDMIVVQVAIARYWGEYAVEWGNILAGSMFAGGVPVCLFLFLQKYYVQGIVRTGLK